jgi:6-hydroxycyclohex-1-ene-1-carbonyl-CoA dehydrogenase
MEVTGWMVHAPGEPMVLESREEAPGPGEVLVEVAGCGVCHTDLSFYSGEVPTRHPLPLTLGHEVSGRVVSAGPGAEAWLDRQVIVPAVLPCGACQACLCGRGSICGEQVFPGNDVHGGFASHLRVRARGLCPVPDLDDPAENPSGLELPTLAVIADAATTPYQAILRSGLEEGDLAVFVGVGGVGGFGVQIAAARGAVVIGIDIDPVRLAAAGEHGASLTLRTDQMEFRELRKKVRALASECGIPPWKRRIFETSGTSSGQETAFGLLEPGGYLSLVGFTPAKVSVRLSNLMALHATAQGNWGCLPEHYPAVLELALTGQISLEPFVDQRPLASINEAFADLKAHRVSRRVVLVPES